MLKTKKFRRLLAGLLAVLMLSICIPAMAFAEDGKDTKSAGAALTITYVDEQGNPVGDQTTTPALFGAGTEYSVSSNPLAGFIELPTDCELADPDQKVVVPDNGQIEIKVKKIGGGDSEEPTEPEETSTHVTVVFDGPNGEVGSETSTYPYNIGVEYPYARVLPIPTGFELVNPNDMFVVKEANATIAVEVKPIESTEPEEPTEPEKVSTYVTFQFYDENGKFLNQTNSSHPYYVGETYGASFIIPMLKGFETIDPDFTFTVDSENAKIQLPVKKDCACEG